MRCSTQLYCAFCPSQSERQPGRCGRRDESRLCCEESRALAPPVCLEGQRGWMGFGGYGGV